MGYDPAFWAKTHACGAAANAACFGFDVAAAMAAWATGGLWLHVGLCAVNVLFAALSFASLWGCLRELRG